MIVLYFWMFSNTCLRNFNLTDFFLRHKISLKEDEEAQDSFSSNSRLPCSPPLVLNLSSHLTRKVDMKKQLSEAQGWLIWIEILESNEILLLLADQLSKNKAKFIKNGETAT